MATPLPNVWHLRTVAESSAKSCLVCLRPAVKVLITADNKDFFYVCPGHLADRGFASPIVDAEAEAAKARKEAMDREIEKVKQEYEERMKKKKGKRKDDGKDKKREAEETAEAEKEKEQKIKAIQDGGNTSGSTDEGPRVFSLHRTFYQLRVDRLRNIEIAKRNQQRFKDPSFFPSVPKGDIA